MVFTKKFKSFDDTILDLHPDLRDSLKPNDHYPELKNILQNKSAHLPAGSFNSRVIINNGQIVERVYKKPMGQVVSLFSKTSNAIFNQVA